MSELLSYNNILKDIQNFKRSGTASGSEFNIYDTPAHKYFRLLFYFGSSSEFEYNDGSGFLSPTWYTIDKQPYYNFNSAWAYLKLNGEDERAEKLEQFITLLSDINTNSPWYFTTLSGIDAALERQGPVDGKIEMTDKKLTINCLPDAFDNRIGTLLELYREIVWSWIQKKEIVPANLRKFDMAVYIFETPELYWHENTTIDAVVSDFNPSYKMIEFHDCEFNYNNIKTAWSELNNQTGISPTYQIEITYADSYEISYNDIMMRHIGDVITTDMLNSPTGFEFDNETEESLSLAGNDQANEIIARTYPHNKSWRDKAIEQLSGHLVKGVNSWVKQKVMGNIFGFSLTGLRDNINDFVNGNIIKTGMSVAQFIKEQKNNYNDKHPDKADGNIFEDSVTNPKRNGSLGNIFNSNTLANNL